ncbi:hypothetical protein AXE65_05570 [Ventosimonas gracilis]|uniref:Glycerophosphoryl diester phosphodiesterase membrane domain-containing protein n=1 Tax=Ventosimonas gracilis TaxID=1680762 RepID=A0A139SNP5_9GAMM|nr:hypothetical protein [Ventosimonas gracilis]KXU36122.1 hypothetical protein AXE65_05570 [Ventosimonas gracilis]
MTTNSTNNNPYSAPQSDLELDNSQGKVPSISEALSRGYDFAIGEVLSEAWSKVSGSKGTIIGAALLTFVLMWVASFIAGLISSLIGIASPGLGIATELTLEIITGALIAPVIAGLFLIGMHRSANYPIRFNMIFDFVNKAVPLLLGYLLMNLVIFVPAALLVGLAAVLGLPIGVLFLAIAIAVIYATYLSVAYIFTLPLMAERDLSPWQALETSRKAVSQRWGKVFAVLILIYLFMLLSVFTLFIGLIWTIPLALIALGIVYRTIFGVLPPTH